MRTIGVIPARYKSSRFPGKPLVELVGIPMIIRVAKIVEKAFGLNNTYIATDSSLIQELVASHGYNVVMTSEDCLTGTDRVWEVAQKINADIYINIQGDEPLLKHQDISRIAEMKKMNMQHVINGMCNLTPKEDVKSLNIPKVVVNLNNILIYMSRLPIPGTKSTESEIPSYRKQVCIYAYNYNELKAFGEFSKKGSTEVHEDIEILRFFDLDIPVKMVNTSGSSLAVDVPEDIKLVEKEILNLKIDD